MVIHDHGYYMDHMKVLTRGVSMGGSGGLSNGLMGQNR